MNDNSIVIPVKNSESNSKEKTNFESLNNNIISVNEVINDELGENNSLKGFEDMSMIGYKKDAFDVTKPIIIKNGFDSMYNGFKGVVFFSFENISNTFLIILFRLAFLLFNILSYDKVFFYCLLYQVPIMIMPLRNI